MLETHTPADRDTVLYLVRHGETEYNRKGIVQGAGVDSVLNDTGWAQARALAGRLSTVAVDAVYASTLRRAKQTAQVVSGPHEPISKTYLRDLEEISWGVFEGDPPSPDRDDAMQAVKDTWRRGDYGYAIENGESIRDVEARSRRALAHVMARHAGGTAVVVAHGRYLRVLLSSVLDGYSLADMPRMDHSNTGVNRVVCRDGRFRADTLNCTRHLSSAPTSP
jgi:probable phosphoglycerate mutase